MAKKTLFLILSGVLLTPNLVLAQLQPYWPGAPRITGIAPLLYNLEFAAWIIFGTVAVISFVISGILFLSSEGQPEKIKTAKAAFIWGIAGVIVGIIAFSIIAIVGNIIT
jgi:hypothetical protein